MPAGIARPELAGELQEITAADGLQESEDVLVRSGQDVLAVLDNVAVFGRQSDGAPAQGSVLSSSVTAWPSSASRRHFRPDHRRPPPRVAHPYADVNGHSGDRAAGVRRGAWGARSENSGSFRFLVHLPAIAGPEGYTYRVAFENYVGRVGGLAPRAGESARQLRPVGAARLGRLHQWFGQRLGVGHPEERHDGYPQRKPRARTTAKDSDGATASDPAESTGSVSDPKDEPDAGVGRRR